MRSPKRLRPSRRGGAAFAITLTTIALPLTSCGGCASSIHRAARWVAGDVAGDYQTAEQIARQSGTGILILYTNIDLTRKDPMREAVKSASARTGTKEYIRCVLFRANEPDRRYVAQYGVDRCPAVIVIHPDGTYHARTGALTEEQAADFLAAATPPGAEPQLNPYIPRKPNYAWSTDLESAEQAAREGGRSLLIVLDRWMTRDWKRLQSMLERREVYTRFADMVHCRPGSLWTSAGSAAARFGVKNLPALVIVDPGGSARSLELPASYESIVRFADAVRLGTTPAAADASPVVGPDAGGPTEAAPNPR